jgi:hypothetical protein
MLQVIIKIHKIPPRKPLVSTSGGIGQILLNIKVGLRLL